MKKYVIGEKACEMALKEAKKHCYVLSDEYKKHCKNKMSAEEIKSQAFNHIRMAINYLSHQKLSNYEYERFRNIIDELVGRLQSNRGIK
jgi:hypothetical protein